MNLKEDIRNVIVAIHEAQEACDPMKSMTHLNDKQLAGALILQAIGFILIDDITDTMAVTTEGKMWAGISISNNLDLPVTVAEVIGDIPESELVARYCEGKVAAIDKSLAALAAPMYERSMSWQEAYQHAALTIRAMAKEFRMGLHIPSQIMEGRVIYYNEDRTTGVSHAAGLQTLVEDIHSRNVKAGWWHDLVTGEKLDRNVGELICLMHSELSEAMEGHRKNLMDDKLPHRPMIEVEFADCVIRIADACGGLGLDLGGAVDEKLAYNATRADHKPENRIAEGGKKY